MSHGCVKATLAVTIKTVQRTARARLLLDSLIWEFHDCRRVSDMHGITPGWLGSMEGAPPSQGKWHVAQTMKNNMSSARVYQEQIAKRFSSKGSSRIAESFVVHCIIRTHLAKDRRCTVSASLSRCSTLCAERVGSAEGAKRD